MLKFPKLFFQSGGDADAFESRIRPDMEQRRYLRADGNVKRRDRLVRDQHFR